MQIENSWDSSIPAAQGYANRAPVTDDFRAKLAAAGATAQGAGTGTTANSSQTKAPTAEEKAKAVKAANDAMATYLQDYAKKSPAQHMREAVLKELGLSEADLAAMPPEKRQAMEAEINRRIREKLLGQEETAVGETVPEVGAAVSGVGTGRVAAGATVVGGRDLSGLLTEGAATGTGSSQ